MLERAGKAEGRNPKAERRPKVEARGIAVRALVLSIFTFTKGQGLRTFGIRNSNFSLLSALGFRPSAFISAPRL
jgi:hypothetical protein